MNHAFVTVAIPFEQSRAVDVEADLDALDKADPDPIRPVLRKEELVHFMSLTVVHGENGGKAHLILEVSADGSVPQALHRLQETIGDALRAILARAGVGIGRSALARYLLGRQVEVGLGWRSRPGLNFCGTPGMTVKRIEREKDLASWVQETLDGAPANGGALDKLEFVRARAFEDMDRKWALYPEPTPFARVERPLSRVIAQMALSATRDFLWPLAIPPFAAFAIAWHLRDFWTALLWFVAIVGAEVVIGVPALLLAWWRFRRSEDAEAGRLPAPSADEVRRLLDREDRTMQNHLAGASTMKPGRIRRLTLRIALWLIGEYARLRSRPGFLVGIGNIHFARWVLLPGTDKLLFFSNYGGSWEAYLEEFIAKAHAGLTGVWSNTVGFPKTKYLFTQGATDGDRFKQWARAQQRPTWFWYTAFPELTTDRLRTHAPRGYGLATARSEAEAANWLTSVGMVPREKSVVDIGNVPTLVFGAAKGLNHGRFIALQLSDDDPDACVRWLRTIAGSITHGDRLPTKEPALVVGFTESGLRKLGLREALASFPIAFQHGMAARARALGDTGDKREPARWDWGGPGNPVDAMLVIYALDSATLEDQTRKRCKEAEALGHRVAYDLLFRQMPPKNSPIQEPFGFTDGISQPIVRGIRDWVMTRNSIHVVEPGEMILGYKDNLGYVPPSPSLGKDDLGLNGTFLVVRQLEQDRVELDRFLKAEAQRLVGDPRVPFSDDPARIAEWLEAKMVGRWKDGTSLVRHPHGPGSKDPQPAAPDNDFLFGTEDPAGLRCPFGAHIRRANPRESFNPGSQVQIGITNRHRIFRVGRSYDPQKKLQKPGLMFMCVNADIERQFEFLQQSWLFGPSFHGLEKEIDPVVGHLGGGADLLTIPTARGPLRLKGMAQFVSVLGGGYFFMPGRQTLHLLAGGARPAAAVAPITEDPKPTSVYSAS